MKLIYPVMLMVLSLAAVSTSWSQNTGKVQGKVTDGGQPVPDAQITLTNADNGRTYKMKADKNGQFSAIGIPAGAL